MEIDGCCLETQFIIFGIVPRTGYAVISTVGTIMNSCEDCVKVVW